MRRAPPVPCMSLHRASVSRRLPPLSEPLREQFQRLAILLDEAVAPMPTHNPFLPDAPQGALSPPGAVATPGGRFLGGKGRQARGRAGTASQPPPAPRQAPRAGRGATTRPLPSI
jgi:hypothetical protein